MAPMPAVTAAAAPPDEPPGVIDGSRGLRVWPCSELRVNQRSEKAGRIGAPEQHRAGLAQVGHDGAVLLRDQVLLQAQAVGGGVALLVGIHLDGDRHAGERAGVLAARDGGVDRGGLGQHVVRAGGPPRR